MSDVIAHIAKHTQLSLVIRYSLPVSCPWVQQL